MTGYGDAERFAARLRMFRERAGHSYEALAQKTGISRSSLHRYCAGASVPQDYGLAHRIATVCGATPAELRELHRLWALADAERDAPRASSGGTADASADVSPASASVATDADPASGDAATAVNEAADFGSSAVSPASGTPVAHGDSGTAPEPATPDTTAAPNASNASNEASGEHSDERSDRPRSSGPPPEIIASHDSGGSGERSRPRRLLTALSVVGVVIALVLGFVVWDTWGSPDNGGAAGHGTRADTGSGTGTATAGRTLFSSACKPVVSMGQHDECVREVQLLLRRRGATIGVDGDFGPETLRRVTAFQVFARIQPNGVVADPTKKALYDSDVRLDTWSPAKVRKRIREVFPEAPDDAVAIADCQSFLDPLHILPNTNGTRNWGLFQISDGRLRELDGTPRKALDPEWNIQAAKRLWSRDRDFHDWPHCERALRKSPSPSKRS